MNKCDANTNDRQEYHVWIQQELNGLDQEIEQVVALANRVEGLAAEKTQPSTIAVSIYPGQPMRIAEGIKPLCVFLETTANEINNLSQRLQYTRERLIGLLF